MPDGVLPIAASLVTGLLVILGVFLQGLIGDRRLRQQNEREDRLHEEERVRSIRSMPLEHLMSVVNSITQVATEHTVAVASMASGSTSPRNQQEFLNAGARVMTDIQRAIVSMKAIGAAPEVFVELSKVAELLETLNLTHARLDIVDVMDSLLEGLGDLERRYLDLKTASESSQGRGV